MKRIRNDVYFKLKIIPKARESELCICTKVEKVGRMEYNSSYISMEIIEFIALSTTKA